MPKKTEEPKVEVESVEAVPTTQTPAVGEDGFSVSV